MYTSAVQCITQNTIPIKLPWTKQFGHQKISNQLFWEFDAWTKSKQTKLYWKKIKCENWVNSTSQGNLTSAVFRICYNWGQLRSEDRVIIEMIPKMISTCRFKDFFLGKQNKCIDIFTENVFLEFNSEMEIINEAGPYIELTAFTLN